MSQAVTEQTDLGRDQRALGRFSLCNRVAVVTGATGLLGRQHCLALSEAGATVVVTDVAVEPCRVLSEEIGRKLGTQSTALAADITKPDEVRVLRDAIIERYGKVDILINNAALNHKVEGRQTERAVPFEEFPLDQWKNTVDVNLTGTFLCCQAFGSVMAKRQYGSIINIASTYGIVGPDQRIYLDRNGRQTLYKSPAYSATKAGLIGLTKYLAAYYGSYAVRANAISPGGVRNGQDPCFIENYAERTPLGRMAEPDDYRGALLYLASDASSYVTGANLVVDGGWTAW